MTGLARRNPALPISKNNQPDRHRGPSRIVHRLRKRPVVLRISRSRQHGKISRQVGRVTLSKSLGNRLHHRRTALPRSKILHLFPERQPVHARQVRECGDRSESFLAVTMIAAPRQQQSTKRIASRNSLECSLRPGHVRRNAHRRFGIRRRCGNRCRRSRVCRSRFCRSWVCRSRVRRRLCGRIPSREQ